MPTFGIIGHGFVGRATARCFMEHGEVRIYDKVPELSTHTVEETLACDFVFVCLPTPDDCDTTIIDEFFAEHATGNHRATFVLKSTVPVGTTRRLARSYRISIIHSPEFLTARCALVDAQCPARMIIGDVYSDYPKCSFSAMQLYRLYHDRFPGTQIHVMRSDESELVKLACNSFFALKIWFFNKLKESADERELNWQAVREGVLSDGRIAHAHTQVPGPDGKAGFGGACLEKDLTAFSKLFDSGIFDDVLRENERMRGE
ncbi:MAG: hypothetical protein KGL39_52030 [Patescibacteria group bacterium]|nr:hypothetical protein [Patescibacteria group bacterium]